MQQLHVVIYKHTADQQTAMAVFWILLTAHDSHAPDATLINESFNALEEKTGLSYFAIQHVAFRVIVIVTVGASA